VVHIGIHQRVAASGTRPRPATRRSPLLHVESLSVEMDLEKEYFEDCAVGDRVVTAGRTVTESDIVWFAQFTGDWNPVHTDAEFAKDTPWGGRIAHGMMSLVVGLNLLFRDNALSRQVVPRRLIAIVGLDQIRFAAPVRIGDTLRLECEIAETKAIVGKGLVSLQWRIRNQQAEAVITGRLKVLVERRPAGEARG
jgi:3-hydroxybutyryl-CoA dehydratase